MTSAWRLRNPEKATEVKRSWSADNLQKCRGYRKKHYDKNAVKKPRPSIDPSKVAARKMLTAARKRAAVRGMLCTITRSDIVIPDTCPLLGIPLFAGTKITGPNSPTLDRKNNDLGYTPGNVWVISHKANSCKGSLTADEIIQVGLRLKEAVERGKP